MDSREDIVAIGLLTQEDIRRLGSSFSRLFPLPQDGTFDDLLKALDEVDPQRPQKRDPRA